MPALPHIYRFLRLEPLLYQTMTLDAHGVEGHPTISSAEFRALIKTGSKAFFRDSVRKLFFGGNEHPRLILATCSNVDTLWMEFPGDDVPVVDMVDHLRLGRLHCYVGHLFGSPENIDFTHQLFAHLTHLDLFDTCHIENEINRQIWAGLALIPQLTHLSYDDVEFLYMSMEILETCRKLRVLLMAGFCPLEEHPIVYEELRYDPRFVMIGRNRRKPVTEWQLGNHTGVDYWSRAEEIVATRTAVNIDVFRNSSPDPYDKYLIT